jgi:hypothetical protein
MSNELVPVDNPPTSADLPVSTQLAEISALRRSDPQAYDNDRALQARELALLDGQLSAEKNAVEKAESDNRVGLLAITRLAGEIGEEVWSGMERSFDRLVGPAHDAVAHELNNPAKSSTGPVGDGGTIADEVRQFAPQVDVTKFDNAALARIHGRIWRVFDRLVAVGTEDEFDRLEYWFSELSPREATSVLKMLAR